MFNDKEVLQRSYICDHLWNWSGPIGMTFDKEFGRGSSYTSGCSKCGLWKTSFYNGKKDGLTEYEYPTGTSIQKSISGGYMKSPELIAEKGP